MFEITKSTEGRSLAYLRVHSTEDMGIKVRELFERAGLPPVLREKGEKGTITATFFPFENMSKEKIVEALSKAFQMSGISKSVRSDATHPIFYAK